MSIHDDIIASVRQVFDEYDVRDDENPCTVVARLKWVILTTLLGHRDDQERQEKLTPPPLRMLPDGAVRHAYEKALFNCSMLDGIILGLFSRKDLEESDYLCELMRGLVAEIRKEIE